MNFDFNTSMTTNKDGSTDISLEFKDSDGTNIQINENGTDLFELFNRVVSEFDSSYADSMNAKKEKEKEKDTLKEAQENVSDQKNDDGNDYKQLCKEYALRQKNYEQLLEDYERAIDSLKGNFYREKVKTTQLENKIKELESKFPIRTTNISQLPRTQTVPLTFKDINQLESSLRNSSNEDYQESITNLLKKMFG